jgi:hypothetical protein
MRLTSNFLTFIFASLILISCSKEDPTEVNVNTSATITGLVSGNTDLSNDFRIELVEVEPDVFENDTIPQITREPIAGVRVFARYNTSALTTVPDPNHTYQDVIVEALTDADGRYVLNVPAGSKAVMVALFGTELEIDLILEEGDTERTTFTSSLQNTSVTQNVTRVLDRIYFAD